MLHEANAALDLRPMLSSAHSCASLRMSAGLHRAWAKLAALEATERAPLDSAR
jgi:hypothetical protein